MSIIGQHSFLIRRAKVNIQMIVQSTEQGRQVSLEGFRGRVLHQLLAGDAGGIIKDEASYVYISQQAS